MTLTFLQWAFILGIGAPSLLYLLIELVSWFTGKLSSRN
jgi:hypothetical protein